MWFAKMYDIEQRYNGGFTKVLDWLSANEDVIYEEEDVRVIRLKISEGSINHNRTANAETK